MSALNRALLSHFMERVFVWSATYIQRISSNGFRTLPSGISAIIVIKCDLKNCFSST